MAVNTGDVVLSEAYCVEARDLSGEIRDLDTELWACGTLSFGLYHSGRYGQADACAAAAVERAPSHAQAIRLLSNGRARALAKTGDRRAVEQVIEQALGLSDLHEASTGLTSCISFEPYGRARTLANAVTPHVALRDTTQVLRDAEHIDDLVEHSTSSWSRALVRLDVATTLLQQRTPDIDHAMTLSREALRLCANTPISSVYQCSRDLLEQAEPWRDHSAVRDYGHEFRAWSQQPWLWRHPRRRRHRCRRTPGYCKAEGVRRVPLLSADPAAFPADPPADTRNPAVTAAHDWAAFRALDEMTNHWARPGWPDGIRAYYWMLTFPHDQPLAALARHCQDQLAPLGLDPVPTDGLHITLARIGSPDAIAPKQLDNLTRDVEALVPSAFAVRAMPLAGSRGAVRLSLGPWEPLLQLHYALAKTGSNAGLAPKKPTSAFRPHLSLAYNNRQRPAAPVVDAVSELRMLPAVELSVAAVQLVELRREGRTYRWGVQKNILLR